VIIGLQGGRTGDVDLGMMLTKRITVSAATLRARSVADKAQIVEGVRTGVWPLVEQHKIDPIVDRSLPMSRAVIAHQVLTASDHIGKVLLLTEGDQAPSRQMA
jgi:NADPH:quinone reductase-like Zn-dependent oxidoreductase